MAEGAQSPDVRVRPSTSSVGGVPADRGWVGPCASHGGAWPQRGCKDTLGGRCLCVARRWSPLLVALPLCLPPFAFMSGSRGSSVVPLTVVSVFC